jgi:hypothetical protein
MSEGVYMDEIIEFRENAEECRTLAAQAASKGLREELLELAAQWSMLAAEHERCLKGVTGMRRSVH